MAVVEKRICSAQLWQAFLVHSVPSYKCSHHSFTAPSSPNHQWSDGRTPDLQLCSTSESGWSRGSERNRGPESKVRERSYKPRARRFAVARRRFGKTSMILALAPRMSFEHRAVRKGDRALATPARSDSTPRRDRRSHRACSVKTCRAVRLVEHEQAALPVSLSNHCTTCAVKVQRHLGLN